MAAIPKAAIRYVRNFLGRSSGCPKHVLRLQVCRN